MDLKAIRAERAGRVAVVTLHRPERLNAWTNRMAAELHWCLHQADDDPDVGAIVITGAGRGFCAGGDMGALDGYAGGTPYEQPGVPAPDEGTFAYLLGLGTPVIAAVNGAAAGVGFVLACFADIRFAAAGVKFTTSFARLGLPAEHGVSWVLPRIVGAGRAADLLFSSRVVLAEEALEMGLVNRVVPGDALLDATLAYANALATEVSPASLRVIKQQLWAETSLRDAWMTADGRMSEMVRSADFVEGVAAFRERRPPRFEVGS